MFPQRPPQPRHPASPATQPRQQSSRHAPACRLLPDLPDEVYSLIALHLAALAPQEIKALLLVSAGLRDRVRPMCNALGQLRFCRVLSHAIISCRCPWSVHKWYSEDSWAVGGLLPSSGCVSWTVVALPTKCLTLASGTAPSDPLVYVGVSNTPSSCAWGLNLYNGRLRRWSRDAHGRVRGAPTPAGYPNGHLRLVTDAYGRDCGLGGELYTRGARIDVLLNADVGTLAFRINDGPLIHALHGFPAGAEDRLRPWCRAVNTQMRITACSRGWQ